MRTNGSMKLLLKLNAALILCLCLLMTVAASAAGLEGQAEGAETSAEGAQAQPEAQPTAPALFTEAQALALAKDHLHADDTWQLVSTGTVQHAGATCYRIVAIDPIGDAHSRLVNASTGEILVESLWDMARGADGQQEGEHQSGQQDASDAQGEANQQGEADHEDESDEQDESDEPQEDADGIENQQEGEFDTADEASAPTGDPAAPTTSGLSGTMAGRERGSQVFATPEPGAVSV